LEASKEATRRTTSARILKGLHVSYALKAVVDRASIYPDAFYLMPWKVNIHEGEAYLMAQSTAEEYRKSFSHAAMDDLRMVGLVEGLPNTGTNALYALSREGLAEAQRLHGPIVTELLVKHEVGVERLRSTHDGSLTMLSGEPSILDVLDDPAIPTQ
jgi:hypothetical protein